MHFFSKHLWKFVCTLYFYTYNFIRYLTITRSYVLKCNYELKYAVIGIYGKKIHAIFG
jgi:hypothetical protein